MSHIRKLLYSDRKSAEVVDCSRSTWHRGVKSGLFPKPVKAGGLTRWIADEVHAIVPRLAAERDSGEAE